MRWNNLQDPKKIIKIIKVTITNKNEIKINLEGQNTNYSSKIIKLNHNRTSSPINHRSSIIIEKLTPDKGNSLIQASSGIFLEFQISDTPFRFTTSCLGICSARPFSGFFLKLPDSVDFGDKRYSDRIIYEMPDFISSEFRLGKQTKDEKSYILDVMDCSIHGLGLIITKDNFDLLDRIKVEDIIEDIAFYTTWSMVKINGTVRHITEIKYGKNKGCYKLGIESRELIDICKPQDN